MPIAAPRYRFTSIIAHGAPEQPGVYALWHDDELIYLGRAASIRQRLLEHLEQFRARYGRPPRCNAA